MNRFFSTAPARRDVLFLIVLGAFLWLTSSGMWELRGSSEGRYVQIAKELLTRSNWFHLTIQGMPYDQKPPLPFWLFAWMLQLNGGEVASWVLRLPSILAAIATVVFTYIMGRFSFNRLAGLFAGLMLMTTPTFLNNAPAAELNMMYTGFITAALCCWITRPDKAQPMSVARAIGFWGSLAGAFFIKGPLAFFIVFAVVGWDAWQNRSAATLRSTRPLAGIVSLALLIGGWLTMQSQIHGDDFVKGQVVGETMKRLLDGDHAEPFWYYLPRLFTNIMFPWALLAIPAVIIYIKNKPASKISPQVSTYLAWFTFPFILLCIANGKRQAYLLPLIPPATILFGAYFEQALAHRTIGKFTQRLSSVLAALVALVLVGFGIFALIQPGIAESPDYIVSTAGKYILVVSGMLAAMVSYGIMRYARQGKDLLYGLVAAGLILVWTNFMVVMPAFDRSQGTSFVSDAVEDYIKTHSRHGSRPLADVTVGAIANASDPEFHVYGRYRVQWLRSSDAYSVTTPSPKRHTPDIVLLRSDNKKQAEISAELVAAGFKSDRSLTLPHQAQSPDASQNAGPEVISFFSPE